MDWEDALSWVAMALVAVGGINWGLIGFFDFNLVLALIKNAVVERVIYAVVGIATAYLLVLSIRKAL